MLIEFWTWIAMQDWIPAVAIVCAPLALIVSLAIDDVIRWVRDR